MKVRIFNILFIGFLLLKVSMSAQIPCNDICYGFNKYEFNFEWETFENKWINYKVTSRSNPSLIVQSCNKNFLIMAGGASLQSLLVTDSLFIIDATSGEVLNAIKTVYFSVNVGYSFLVADVNGDGEIEIIIASHNELYNPPALSRRLVCYDIMGNVKWVSNEPFASNRADGFFAQYSGIAIADFNLDGVSEVYIMNKIYNARTGILLVDGGDHGKGINNLVGRPSLSVAYNIIEDSPTLELIAGYTVYKVHINNIDGIENNSMEPFSISINNNFYDGFTSIADINADGTLDVIVGTSNSNIGVYVYTFKNGNLSLLDYSGRNYPGKFNIHMPVTVMKINPGVEVDILFRSCRNNICGYFSLAFDEEVGLIEKLNISSSSNSSFSFIVNDFDLDGFSELIFADSNKLNIYYVNTGEKKYIGLNVCDDPQFSFGQFYVNLSYDILNDQICFITFCKKNDIARLTAFGPPAGQKWPPVRSVRHQYAYNPLFINDDMTVPSEMPDMVTYKNGKYNNFGVQETLIDENGNYPVAAASVSGEITCVNYDENTDSYTVRFYLYNREEASKAAATGMPVAFYSEDPQSGGTLLGVYHTQEDIEAGSYINGLSLHIPATSLDRIWMVVNTDRSELMLSDSSHYALSECDYTDNVHVMYDLPHIERRTVEICEGESYEFYSMMPTASGRYVHRVLNSRNCDSVVSVLELEITDTKREQISLSACDEYHWQGNTYTSTGMYDYQTESATGCDSIVSLDLTIYPSYEQSTQVSSCEQYEWQGSIYEQSGSYLLTLETSAGCDSLLRLELTIHPTYEAVTQVSSCDSYQWQGQTYTESGTYHYIGQTAAGCDSIEILELEIVPVLFSTEEVISCGSYEWNGTLYTESGSYQYESLSASGCDSITTLELTLYQSDYVNETATACDSYSWAGVEYTESGSYEYMGQNRYGCDSIVVLELTINNSIDNTLLIESCDAYEWNGTEYTESGSYLYTGLTSAGCDSTMVLELTVHQSVTITEEVTACGRHEWQGQIYHESGSYSYTVQTIHGCDSTVVLELTIHPEYENTLKLEGCDELEYGGVVYTEPGIYQLSYTSAMGCDSMVVLEVNLHSELSEASIITCDSYTWPVNGERYTESGTYTQIFSNSYGCDSIEQLYLELHPSYSIEELADACGRYVWPATGEEITASGKYTHRYETVHGCDSIRILDIHIHPEYSLRDTVISPSAYRWPVTESTYEESGEYTASFETDMGCDSVHVLYLTIRAGTDLYYANILRPEGGDSVFRIYSQDRGMEIITLGIYDRWGQQVYQIENIRANESDWGWNGHFQGQPVVAGVYVWIAQLRYSDGSTGTVSGDVTVVR